jgi:hypothetical protein
MPPSTNPVLGRRASSNPQVLPAGRPAAAAPRPRLRPHQELVTVLLATWLIVGLFVDGWAHDNVPELETFFTPWHAVFYSGFAATAGWMAWLVGRNRCLGRRGLAAVPVGYGLGLAGVGIFAVGGAGDATWHAVFGIEADLAALLSPTHLLLFTGILLILTSPLRAAWTADEPTAPGFRAFLPVTLALTLTMALVGFFFQYLSPFLQPTAIPYARFAAFWAEHGLVDPAVQPGLAQELEIRGIASLLLTSLLFVAPVLLVLRRWQPPFGLVTFLFGAVAALLGTQHNLELWPAVVAAVAAGLAGDLLIWAWRPSPARLGAYRAVAALLPAALLGSYFVAVAVAFTLAWPPELWAGTIFYGTLIGLALSLLMVPRPTRPPASQ